MLWIVNVFGLAASAAAIASGFAAALFPLYRAYFWLRYGFGLSYSALDFLIENDKNDISGVRRAVLETKWLGVQKAFMWLLSQPFELSCVALAVVCGIVAKVLFDVPEPVDAG